jgi:hypothetical protein
MAKTTKETQQLTAQTERENRGREAAGRAPEQPQQSQDPTISTTPDNPQVYDASQHGLRPV